MCFLHPLFGLSIEKMANFIPMLLPVGILLDGQRKSKGKNWRISETVSFQAHGNGTSVHDLNINPFRPWSEHQSI